jgi:hypothetical protein
MKKFATCLALSVLTFQISAQIDHGGQPHNWNSKIAPQVSFRAMPAVDVAAYQREDAVNDLQKEIPYRFGVNIPTDLDINNNGDWSVLENGDRIWRMGIHAAGAISINFVFDQYILPEGGKVFVYDADRKQLKGSFTNENADHNNSLGVGFVMGENVVIEYHEPAAFAGQGYLHINNVTHGYRSVQGLTEEKSGPFGNSGPCNINVNCPQGDPYGDQIRSVAIIVVNNNGSCTGSLVNTVLQDGTPYFLTANHCLGNVGNWIFYFNHEAPECVGNTGPTSQSVSGATLVASSQESDFGLLLLNNPPPASFNVCYNGWDATDNEASVLSAYGIHHPGGNVKKICFEEDAPYHQSIGSFVNQTWYIDQWELGVTEGGSSGSPLFNQSGRVIGMLSGGAAACSGTVNNGQFDFYGRFGVAWDFGNSASSRLRDWLDPTNTGTLVVSNSCSESLITNDISLGPIQNISTIQCNTDPLAVTLSVINVGLSPVTSILLNYSINEGDVLTYTWQGTIAPQQAITLEIGTIMPEPGENSIAVYVNTVNGVTDLNTQGNAASLAFIALENAAEVGLFIDLDNYPNETTWQITADTDILYSGGSYTSGDDPVNQSFCLEPNACYEFTIFDSANDGICCGFGQGSYQLTDATGEMLAEGGDFGTSESTSFCLSGISGTSEALGGHLQLYPNPAGDFVMLDTGEVSGNFQRIQIYDAIGKIVWQSRSDIKGTEIFQISTVDFAPGIYIVSVQTDRGNLSGKLFIAR